MDRAELMHGLEHARTSNVERAPIIPIRERRLLIIAPRILIVGLALLVAAASFSGYYTKWQFRDVAPESGLNKMLDGTAMRPYAYRRLVVDTVNAIDQVAPPAVRLLAAHFLHRRDGTPRLAFPSFVESDSSKILRYVLVYFITYLSAVALTVLGYKLARSEGFGPFACGAGAASFMLIFPLMQSFGGFFYDYIELAFFCLFLLLARKAWWPAMLAVTVLATWSKESFFFFALTAYPLLRERKSVPMSAAITASCVALAGLTYEVARIRFGANAGDTAEYHLIDQLNYFLSGIFLVKWEITYGVPLPHPFSLPSIIAVTALVAVGWRWVTPAMRQQIAIAAALNVPLFLLFCAPGEARNLSMLFPGLLVMMAAAFQASTLCSSAYQLQR